MPNFTFSGGTATIGTTEWSAAQNAAYSSGSPKTTLGYVQAFFDVSALAAPDQFQIRVYEKVNGGTQRVISTMTVPPSTELFVVQVNLLLGEGWDITIKKITGTDRSILFSVRQDTNDVAFASLGAGSILSTTFAAGAITSGVIAADAIGAAQLAADAVAEIQSGRATSAAQTTAQTDLTTLTGRLTSGRATNLDNLDAAVSTRAASATALSTATWTNGRAALIDHLDADVSTRAVASTAVSNVDYTGARATKLDALDATVSSRAPASTALSTADYTGLRAAKLDNLDAAVTTRAAAATAVSSADLTPTRAARLDNLDAAVSTAATASALSVVSSAVSAVIADTDNIQTRLPAALDGSGNIMAAMQSAVADSITAASLKTDAITKIQNGLATATAVAAITAATASAVWAVASEAGETFGDAIRNIAARLFGAGTVQDGDGAYTYKAKDGIKTRLSMTRSGTARTVGTRDGT